MDTQTQTQVTMSAEELAEFEAFKASQAKKNAIKQRKAALDAYQQIIDKECEELVPLYQDLSNKIAELKAKTYEDFKAAIDLKDKELGKVKDGQKSHTFTNSAGDKRITLGYYVNDNYLDSVNDGIAMVNEYLDSLAKDSESQTLLDMVKQLLARDQKGTLKASRVLQLNKLKNKITDSKFGEGVDIIMEAYAPTRSKTYIKAEYKSEDGKWLDIPLNVTNAGE